MRGVSGSQIRVQRALNNVCALAICRAIISSSSPSGGRSSQIKHKDTHIAFSPDFLLNNRFSFNYKGFEAALQSQFVSKQYMTNAEVEELTLDKYFVSNLNLAYSFRPKKVLKEVTVGFTVYNLFNEKYENNGWASSDYTDTVENRGNYAGYAAQAGTNVMGHVSFRF